MKVLFKKNVTILLLFMFFTPMLFSQRILIGEDKVAKVNNKVITLQELKKTHEQMNALYSLYGQRALSEKEVLQTIIDFELLQSAVKNANIVLDENQFNQELQQYKQAYAQEMMQKDPNFQYSDAEFENYVKNSSSVTYEEFIDKLKVNVLARQYVQRRAQAKLQAAAAKNYPDSELKAYRQENISMFVMHESVELKHIFFQTIDGTMTELPPAETVRIKKKADDVLNRLKKGENFDTLCELNSDDENSRDFVHPETGEKLRGYLGLLSARSQEKEAAYKQFGKEIVDELFKLPAQSYSRVLKSPFGYHIFYVIKKESERLLSFEESKEGLLRQFRLMEQQRILVEEQSALLEELRKTAEIKYYKDEYKQ